MILSNFKTLFDFRSFPESLKVLEKAGAICKYIYSFLGFDFVFHFSQEHIRRRKNISTKKTQKN